jgi:hypothetical protein
MDDITSNERKRSAIQFGSASGIQVLAALGGIALAIIGLCKVDPMLMLCIAAIVLGGGLLIGRGLTAVNLSSSYSGSELASTEEFDGGGMVLAFFGGIVGVTLGILSLVSVMPNILLPTAAIVFGAVMLLSAWPMERTARFTTASKGFLEVSSLTEILGGSAAIALGILALNGYNLVNLTLIGFLSVGFSFLVTSFSLVGKTYAISRQRGPFST